MIYTRVAPTVDNDTNLADARRLMDEWGIGRRGFDDGFVILLSFDDSTFQHGTLSTYAGSGFKAVYLSEDPQARLRDDVIIPAIQGGDVGRGLIAAVDEVDAQITPTRVAELQLYRTANALIGIPGSALALIVTLGFAFAAWKRYGDDPELTDSPSILMAGPPADMTPPLATVIRAGRASQQSINTTLVELAGSGYIAFRNLDQVKRVKSDDDANPLIDPAIDILKLPEDRKQLPKPEAEAYEIVRRAGHSDGIVTRHQLWHINDQLEPVKEELEEEAVRLGWLARMPSPLINRWSGIGIAELVVGGILVVLGYVIPMSGLTLLGFALGVGGIGTIAFGHAMSQRTREGAYVDAMLKAYRRTLQKTLEQARDMNQVVQDPQIRTLADTPDKAVVWGIALGLHQEVATGAGAQPGRHARGRCGCRAATTRPGWAAGIRPACPAAAGSDRAVGAAASSPARARRTSAACSDRWAASAPARRPAPHRPAAAASAEAGVAVAEAAAAGSDPAPAPGSRSGARRTERLRFAR